MKLYKIPHDEAVKQYNEAVAKYNSAVDLFTTASAALEDRNKALDDSIADLGRIVYAENLPIDEFLLAEAVSVLTEARSVTKDTAQTLSEMPQNTDEMIAEFQGCKTEVIWTGVDEEYNVLRFVVIISNDNGYVIRDVTTEWIAYDKNDAIVGSHDAVQADIPANGHIYYVGGAGSANLSGTPARVEIRVTTDGILTNREMPQISLSNIQIINRGWDEFDVTADCVTDSDIMTANLDGQIIVKDAEGQIY